MIVKVFDRDQFHHARDAAHVVAMPMRGDVVINLLQSGYITGYVRDAVRISILREPRIDEE